MRCVCIPEPHVPPIGIGVPFLLGYINIGLKVIAYLMALFKQYLSQQGHLVISMVS